MSVLYEVAELAVKDVPMVKPGHTVRVHQKIKEGSKERIQIFEGLVIKVSGDLGANRTFTVRRVVEGIGVEKIFPLYSKTIAKIEVTKKAKIRRAKLYHMRERFGKSARLKEDFVTPEELAKLTEKGGKKLYLQEEAIETENQVPAEETPKQTEEVKAESPAEKKEEVAEAKTEEPKEEK